jgi:hypothetical protein
MGEGAADELHVCLFVFLEPVSVWVDGMQPTGENETLRMRIADLGQGCPALLTQIAANHEDPLERLRDYKLINKHEKAILRRVIIYKDG